MTGLIAGEEVNVQAESRDMLMTHRNLNFIATVVAGCMGLRRYRRRQGALCLDIGALGIGIVAYTAHLEGEHVYESGVRRLSPVLENFHEEQRFIERRSKAFV